jgi:hypothetical protein
MYIPVCPVTDTNARYLARQREAFLAGTPGPDFGGGKGESEHIGRPTDTDLSSWTDGEGVGAMGLKRLVAHENAAAGELAAVESANIILGL